MTTKRWKLINICMNSIHPHSTEKIISDEIIRLGIWIYALDKYVWVKNVRPCRFFRSNYQHIIISTHETAKFIP